MPDAAPWIWTAPRRRALGVLVLFAALALSARALLNPLYVSDPVPAQGRQADALADRLDPNTASAAMLSALPTPGEKRSAEIVAFRTSFTAAHPGRLAFRRPEDLTRVRGIGPATVERLTPFLTFPPSDASSSGRSSVSG